MLGLIDRATVYTPDPTTGRFTVVATSGLRCRLAHVSGEAGASRLERAELAALRNLIWEPGYVMPEEARVLIDGVTYALTPGTYKALRGPSGAITRYRQCDAVRAD